jgi:hypothetical protein
MCIQALKQIIDSFFINTFQIFLFCRKCRFTSPIALQLSIKPKKSSIFEKMSVFFAFMQLIVIFAKQHH